VRHVHHLGLSRLIARYTLRLKTLASFARAASVCEHRNWRVFRSDSPAYGTLTVRQDHSVASERSPRSPGTYPSVRENSNRDWASHLRRAGQINDAD